MKETAGGATVCALAATSAMGVAAGPLSPSGLAGCVPVGASSAVGFPLPLGFLCPWVSCFPGGGASSVGFTRGLLSSAVLLVLVLVFFVGMFLLALSSRLGVAFLGWRLFLACPVVNRGGLGATLVLLGLKFLLVLLSLLGFRRWLGACSSVFA